ncbi:MAG TPA: hypothetical protein VGP94_06895 [Tepidisphaeraceae bacterium]|nr:hypothetical protein [Tepidisphaeraceae bacterium]
MQNDSPDVPARRNFLHFIIDHNPCYLLSGLFMLTGCWLLNFALYTKAGDISKLLLLLLITNLYEFLLIALGLLLIKRIAFKRDGRILLALEALFLIDITFTSGVLSTIDLHIGLLINTAILLLAATKLLVILRGLNLPHSPRMAIFILTQIACILLIPTLYKYIALPHHGRITALNVYFTWWITALLPLLALFLHRLPNKQLLAPTGTERHLGLLFLLLPFSSLIIHLHSSAWVYSIHFTAAFITPLLLGLAISATFLESRVQRYLIARIQCLLIALSIFFSISFPSTLFFSLSRGIDISPLRLTLLASALLFLYFIFHHDNLTYLYTAAICVIAALLGPTLAIIWQNLTSIFTSSRRLIPKTTLQWGLISIATSFLLLLLGALLSLKKHLALHRAS